MGGAVLEVNGTIEWWHPTGENQTAKFWQQPLFSESVGLYTGHPARVTKIEGFGCSLLHWICRFIYRPSCRYDQNCRVLVQPPTLNLQVYIQAILQVWPTLQGLGAASYTECAGLYTVYISVLLSTLVPPGLEQRSFSVTVLYILQVRSNHRQTAHVHVKYPTSSPLCLFSSLLRYIIQRRKWNRRPWWGWGGCLWSTVQNWNMPYRIT